MHPTPRHLLVVLVLTLTASFARAHAPAVDMLDSATAFLNALTPDQKKQATYSLTDPERENWFFTPVPRQGLPLKQLNPQQRDLALALLRSGLSQRGLARAEAIMSMELVLKELEKDTPPGRRDPSNYLVTVFGPPDARKSWGWRFEGHHLSFNFTLVDGAQLFFAPSFIGSNPAEVRSGPRKGERVLGEEEDAGRALVKSLDAAQRKLAVLDGKAPGEIITSNKKRTAALTPAGLSATAMTATQRDQLLALIKLYASRQRPEISDATMAKVTVAGVDKLTFAWAGGFERGDPHYYRVQGPEFLIEFDNTQNDANHIHSVFRDFKGDFANDLLREHYANDHGK